MKRTIHHFGLFISALCPLLLSAQNYISGIVNNYTVVLSFEGCDSTLLTVGASTDFFVGDKVLLIQMQGSLINLNNTESFGEVIAHGNAGNFEMNRIGNISGNKIQLQYKLFNSYDISGKVQLIRVPEYGDVVVSDLTCKPWDGATGGVLSIEVKGSLILNGNMDVSAKGFRGGVVEDVDSYNIYHKTDFYYSNADTAGAKGEGISILPVNLSFGRGRSGNGGGGGNAHNAGGGGGGNGGEGGNGGLEYFNTPASPTPGTQGVGGKQIFETDGQRIILGGGGGAGHTNDDVGTSGGAGGGIIIIKSNDIQTNGYKLFANGSDVAASGNKRNDGQGGGGAGGSILIQSSQINGILNCELKGGFGGDCLFYVPSQIIGPGGGGGGGKLMLSQNFNNLSANIGGGLNGFANQNLTNGAQPGQKGVILTNIQIIEDYIPSGIIANSHAITFCPSIPFILNDITYTEPTVITDTLRGNQGCDTIVTYILEYDLIDLTIQLGEITCQSGHEDLHFILCNQGTAPLPAMVTAAFYDANPFAGWAQHLGNLIFQTAGIDTCWSGIFPFIDTVLNLHDGPLYAVINFDGSLSAPLPMVNFPVTGIDECNFQNNLSSTIISLPAAPYLDLGPDHLVCHDSTVVFDAGADFIQYMWQDSSTASTFTTSVKGTYWVVATDACGRTQSDTVMLLIEQLPPLLPDTILCLGDVLPLYVPGFVSYLWMPATEISCANCPNPVVSPTGNTTYTLQAVSALGCLLNDTFELTLRQPLLEDTVWLCSGESVHLNGKTYTYPGVYFYTLYNASGSCDTLLKIVVRQDHLSVALQDSLYLLYGLSGLIVPQIQAYTDLSYVWTPQLGLDHTDVKEPVANPPNTTTYTLKITDAFGCTMQDSIVVAVQVLQCAQDIYIPNVFYPNSNGINSHFTLFANPECIANIQVLRVFNRWGELVFEKHNFLANDYSLGWDGFYKNRITRGVYVYYAELENYLGETERMTGSLLVL